MDVFRSPIHLRINSEDELDHPETQILKSDPSVLYLANANTLLKFNTIESSNKINKNLLNRKNLKDSFKCNNLALNWMNYHSSNRSDENNKLKGRSIKIFEFDQEENFDIMESWIDNKLREIEFLKILQDSNPGPEYPSFPNSGLSVYELLK